MPIYEYRCESCHKRFEKLQKVSDPPCKKCPDCGGPLRKIISSPAIQFKGKGFYVTDYAKKSAPEADKKSGAESAPKEPKGTEKKAETKPEAEPLPAEKPCPD